MGCSHHHCFGCFKSSKDSNEEFRWSETAGCFSCKGSSSEEKGRERDQGIGCLCCRESSSSLNDVSHRGSGCCCFPCKKSSKDDEFRREGKEKKCFACFKSFKEELKGRKGTSCGIRCFCCGESSSKDGLPESRGCSCFPCKKSRRKKEKNNKCFSCFRSSEEEVNERNRRGHRNDFLCREVSSKTCVSSKKRGCCCCFPNKKSSEENKAIRGGRDNECFSCFRPSKKEKEKKCCMFGCFRHNESSPSKGEQFETRGSCLSSKKPSKKDPKSRGEKDNICSCSFSSSNIDSSKKGKRTNSDNKLSRRESTRKDGRTSWCCFSSCCSNKTSKDHSLKEEGGRVWFCFQCSGDKTSNKLVQEEARIPKKKSKESSMKKRGSKVMCCCAFCCTKALDERKPTSNKTKCIISCFCCIQESYQNSSMEKRRGGLCCLQVKEQTKDKNHGVSPMQTTSFTSDNDGKNTCPAEEIIPHVNSSNKVQVFAYKEIVAATKNFNEDFLIGSGGFGKVYRGEHLGKNEVVAVKQLKWNENPINNEFLVDVVTLSLLHHPNLIKLLGYCAERDQMVLVYEYMPFGSLQNHLLDITPDTKPLDWFTRMKIAAGAAKGLEHLHDVANPPMIYRDMKASNILLDENYNAKLSDFGLEKPARVMGTYGCCAPEYAFTRKPTKTTDVYSFGVLLLELITGRKAIDSTRQKTEQYLAHWAAPLFKDKRKFPKMADHLLNGNFPIKDLYQALAIANMCLQYEASSRPLMSDVVTAIEYLAKRETDCSEPSEGLQIHHQLRLSNHEELEIPGRSQLRTSTVSFDGETFQSLSSDIESFDTLREEDEQED